MDLIHFSVEPLTSLRDTAQVPEPGFKPRGLWVSDEASDDGWQAWCDAANFARDRLPYRTRIHLRPDHRVLVLTTAIAIVRFTDDYGAWPAYMRDAPWRQRQGFMIDLALVAKDYQGLIITLYQWSRRLDTSTFWYYGWDCASGCFWAQDAVAQLEPISMPITGIHL